MCEAFADNGFKVELVYPRRNNPSGKDVFDYYGVKRNFRVTRLLALDFYLPGKFDSAAFFIKNFISSATLFLYSLLSSPDIIFSRDELPIYLLSLIKRNLVFEAHKLSNKRSLFYNRFKKMNFLLVTISNGLKDDFIKYGFNPERIIVAPDGVDTSMFFHKVDKNAARSKLNLPRDNKIILYTGHLYGWKGADVLAKSAEYISDALFVFVGGVGAYLDTFKQKYGLIKNILILGHKPYSEMPQYLSAADVLVLPNSAKEEISLKYTSPLKLFEYMASGRPIVASKIPSILEVLNDRNAILVDPDNSKLLSDGIRRVLDNDELMDKISKQALEDVQRFSWSNRARIIISNFTNDSK
jgi:glycosyltransferase involved in cell wall biosynthesis